jgi:transcriptional regulator with XRE-family HTH domain
MVQTKSRNERPGLTPRLARIASNAVRDSGHTQQGVADTIGVSVNTVGRRLNGHRSFTIDELDALASLLGVKVSTLVLAAERSPLIPTQRQPKES